MTWKIEYTDKALRDLKEIYEYIAFILCVPETAGKQVLRLENAIRKLDNMPEMFRVYEEEPWKSMNVRFFPVDNYLVFYLIKKEISTVSIVRIIYGGRDISAQLRGTNEL